MKAQELLSKYPLAAKVVKDWFLEQMIESMNTDSVPEEFKQSILAEGISDDRLATVIDAQPRALFDVFDKHKIFICISVWTKTPGDFKNVEFGITLNATNKNNSNFSSRKEAESVAIGEAFEILENKLTPIELPKLEE